MAQASAAALAGPGQDARPPSPRPTWTEQPAARVFLPSSRPIRRSISPSQRRRSQAACDLRQPRFDALLEPFAHRLFLGRPVGTAAQDERLGAVRTGAALHLQAVADSSQVLPAPGSANRFSWPLGVPTM